MTRIESYPVPLCLNSYLDLLLCLSLVPCDLLRIQNKFRKIKYIICENLEKKIRAIRYKLSELQQTEVVRKTKLAKVLAARSRDTHTR